MFIWRDGIHKNKIFQSFLFVEFPLLIRQI